MWCHLHVDPKVSFKNNTSCDVTGTLSMDSHTHSQARTHTHAQTHTRAQIWVINKVFKRKK